MFSGNQALPAGVRRSATITASGPATSALRLPGQRVSAGSRLGGMAPELWVYRRGHRPMPSLYAGSSTRDATRGPAQGGDSWRPGVVRLGRSHGRAALTTPFTQRICVTSQR